MAIKISELYSDATAPNAAYPYGSSKNVSGPAATDGTPFEKVLIDDQQGFLQSLLVAAGVVPTGSADSVTAPQYLTAVANLRWFNAIDYAVGSRVIASDGVEYTCKQANGPSSTVRDPSTAANRPTYWRDAAIEAMDRANPVGTIRIFAVGNNPAELLGFGTWVSEAGGRTIFGFANSDNDFDVNGRTGGSKTHNHGPGTYAAASHTHAAGTLTADSHTHEVPTDGYGSIQASGALPEPSSFGRLVTGSGRMEDNEQLESLGHANSVSIQITGLPNDNGISGNTGNSQASITGTGSTTSIIPPYVARHIWRRSA